jgi:hypothetical protein
MSTKTVLRNVAHSGAIQKIVAVNFLGSGTKMPASYGRSDVCYSSMHLYASPIYDVPNERE